MSDTTPKRTLRMMDARDGHVCVLQGRDTGRLVPQHRAGGMGGRAGKHRASNVVWLDSLDNGAIEANGHLANVARVRGIKISQHADPERIPVYFAREAAWFRLADDGAREQITSLAALDLMHDFYGDAYFDMQAAASRSWHGGTRPDDSLVCASVRLRVLCGRIPARVVGIRDGADDAAWDAVTCQRCSTLRTGVNER